MEHSKAYELFRDYLRAIRDNIENRNFGELVLDMLNVKSAIPINLYRNNLSAEEFDMLSKEYEELANNPEFQVFVKSLNTLIG